MLFIDGRGLLKILFHCSEGTFSSSTQDTVSYSHNGQFSHDLHKNYSGSISGSLTRDAVMNTYKLFFYCAVGYLPSGQNKTSLFRGNKEVNQYKYRDFKGEVENKLTIGVAYSQCLKEENRKQ